MSNHANSGRETEITAFIASAGWSDAKVESFPGDASSRRYFRLTRGDDVAVLMDAPKGAEALAPFLVPAASLVAQ